jgi:hypothetical protein
MDFAMAAPLKTVEGSNIAALMHEIGQRAKSAARVLALAPTAQKDRALAAMAAAIRTRQAEILAANAKDVAEAKAASARRPFSTASRSTGAASPRWPTASTSCVPSPIRSAWSPSAGRGRTA